MLFTKIFFFLYNIFRSPVVGGKLWLVNDKKYTFSFKLFTKKKLGWSKLKQFSDDKSEIAQMPKFVNDRVENSVAKGGNAGYHDFLVFQQCFQKASYTG